jgi:DNA-binding transcriptional ArsR family regulator
MFMNDCTGVNTWQDGSMTERSTPDPPAEARAVTTVAELKALADPLRLAILDALSGGPARELRVLSVKELAAELGEPKTKLYRHIKLLEAAGLIRVAATRLVSGIVEQRYQACQIDLAIGPWSMRDPGAAAQTHAMVGLTLDHYRRRYLDYLAALPPSPAIAEGRSMLTAGGRRLSPARARVIQDKLREVVAELDRPAQPGDDADDAVQIEVLVSYMTPG